MTNFSKAVVLGGRFKTWFTEHNNNNRFTAVCPDYPGEPVLEETLTHPPSPFLIIMVYRNDANNYCKIVAYFLSNVNSCKFTFATCCRPSVCRR